MTPNLPLSQTNVVYLLIGGLAMILVTFLAVRARYRRRINKLVDDKTLVMNQNKYLEERLDHFAKNIVRPASPLEGSQSKPRTATEGLATILGALAGLAGLLVASTGLFNAVWAAHLSGQKLESTEKALKDYHDLVFFSNDEWKVAFKDVPQRISTRPETIGLDDRYLKDLNLKNLTVRYEGRLPGIIETSAAEVTLKITLPAATGVRMLLRPLNQKSPKQPGREWRPN